MNYKKAKLLTFWIPFKKFRQNCRKKLMNFFFSLTINKYSLIIKALQDKIKNGQKIKVGFYVAFDSSFQTQAIFEKMLKSDIFEPFILVIPDVHHGKENMIKIMEKTYKFLSEKYDCVYKSYNEKTKQFTDFSDKTDIIFFNNIYDELTHKLYTVEYNASKGILPCYTDYGYTVSNLHYLFYKDAEYNLMWRIFALEENEYNKLQESILEPKNVILSGYCKMDKIKIPPPRTKSPTKGLKKLIIAPHHSVNKKPLNLSNFLTYCDFFLELPKLYPDIDFVFRPHPGLFITLSEHKLWGKEKVEEYIREITQYPNVEYQNGGEYFDTFINSDGLIHDCGSFSAEYLYTEHPCCYMLKDEALNNKNSNEFHKSCIDKHYKAYSKQDIINFIEEVIIKGNDTKKEERKIFFEKALKLNYPNTADFIINELQKELKVD